MAWFRCAVGHVSAGIFMERLRVFSGMSWCLRLDWDFPCVESADFLLSQEHFKSQTWENIHVTAVLGAAAAKMSLFSAQRWCVSLRHTPKVCPVHYCLLFSPLYNFSLSFLFPWQLVLEAHNVPELSAGVNCTFEDLAEMDGLVEGNRITCSSPAEKEVPRIVVDQGVNMRRH